MTDGPGGALVLVEENHDLPLVRAVVALRVGGGDDPQGKDGTANFSAELLARGAAGQTRAEIDAAFDALGTSLDISTDHDSITFEITVLEHNLDAALALFADVILRPDFPSAEADKLRREIRAQLDDLRDDDAHLARRFFQHLLFGAHPYGRTVIGTEASMARFDAELARAWHQRNLVGGNVVFGLAGDVAPARAAELVARHFAALSPGSSTASERPMVSARQGQRLNLIDKPERTQSQILMGHSAPRWADGDFHPLQIATTAFGGTFTARLMQEVRAKRGLSYGASARLGQGRGARGLVAHVFPSLEQTPETLELVLRLYREWAEDGLTDEEVAFAKGYLGSSFAFSIATPEERLDLRMHIEVSGLPPDHIDRYVDRIRGIDAAEVRRAMRAHLRPDDLEICVVSTAEALQPLLGKLVDGRALEVIPYDSY